MSEKDFEKEIIDVDYETQEEIMQEILEDTVIIEEVIVTEEDTQKIDRDKLEEELRMLQGIKIEEKDQPREAAPLAILPVPKREKVQEEPIEEIIKETTHFTKEEKKVEEEAPKNRDTSFSTYEKEADEKDKNFLKKLGSKLGKGTKKLTALVIGIPVLVILACLAFGVIASGYFAAIAMIGAGLIALGVGAFAMGVYSGNIGWLGIFAATALLSGGGIVFCVMTVLTKWAKKFLPLKKQQHAMESEEK